jgi:hypothetical protein
MEHDAEIYRAKGHKDGMVVADERSVMSASASENASVVP